jgi:microcystin synthetase protein McyA
VVVVGDVRSRPLLEPFHASVQLFQAPSNLSRQQLARRAQRHKELDRELTLDPAFFYALRQHLPRITRVEVLHKHARHLNEMSCYRYDVLLHIGPPEQPQLPVEWIDWSERGAALASLRHMLASQPSRAVGIRRVPNARVLPDVKLVTLLAESEGPATAAEIRKELADARAGGLEPAELRDLALEYGYELLPYWSGAQAEACFDAVFIPQALAGQAYVEPATADWSEPPRPWYQYANSPLQWLSARKLVPQLRDFLQERLPEHMIPAGFMVLDSLPLTPNGKLDRKALPPFDSARSELTEAFVAPRTPLEEQLVAIWSQVLGVEQIGVHDNFFELGGDSILSIQIVARATQAGIQMQTQHLFQHQTIAELASVVRVAGGEADAAPSAPAQAADNADQMFAWNQDDLADITAAIRSAIEGV